MNVLTLPFYLTYLLSRRASESRIDHYADLCESSFRDISDDISYITLIDGPIRCGKSTTCCILVNYLVQKLDAQASQMLDFIRRICFRTNFQKLDHIIEKTLKNTEDVNEIVTAIWNDEGISKSLAGYFDDGLKKTPRRLYMFDYVEAYIAFKTKKYVKSNIPFTDQIFRQKAEPFDIFDFSILDLIPKNLEDFNELLKDKRKYKLSRYTVYFIDDISIYPEINSLNFQKFKGAESGFSAAWRLFGQLMKESGYIVFNSQCLTRVVKESREIVQTFLHIESKKPKLTYSVSRWSLEKILRIKKWCLKWSSKVTPAAAVTLRKLSEVDYLILLQQTLFNSNSYLKITTSFKNGDGEKVNCDPLEIYAPAKFGYASFETHFFSYLHDLFKMINKLDLSSCETDEELKAAIDDLLKHLDPFQRSTFESLIRSREEEDKKKKRKPTSFFDERQARENDFF